MNELKHCPFCGCDMFIRVNRDWSHLSGYHDGDCVFTPYPEHTLSSTPDGPGQEELVKDWNRRFSAPSPPQDPRDEVIRVAREALEKLAPVVIGNYHHAVYSYIRQIKEILGEK